jgi:hypothetical protein
MYYNITHAWRHVFLWCSMYVPEPLGKEIVNHHLSMPACSIINQELYSASVLWFYCRVCMCVSARICSRWQGKHQAWKEENWLYYPVLKGWTAWMRLYWVKYCTVQSVQFVSLPLLGKLGTRQYFQRVSGREIAQSTEEWHKNEVVYIKLRIIVESVRLSCMPSLYMSYLLLGKLGTRQYFEKVSGRRIAQSTEEWHKNEVVYIKLRIFKYVSVYPACRHFICLTCY